MLVQIDDTLYETEFRMPDLFTFWQAGLYDANTDAQRIIIGAQKVHKNKELYNNPGCEGLAIWKPDIEEF
jgi:hypothetical protein